LFIIIMIYLIISKYIIFIFIDILDFIFNKNIYLIKYFKKNKNK